MYAVAIDPSPEVRSLAAGALPPAGGRGRGDPDDLRAAGPVPMVRVQAVRARSRRSLPVHRFLSSGTSGRKPPIRNCDSKRTGDFCARRREPAGSRRGCGTRTSPYASPPSGHGPPVSRRRLPGTRFSRTSTDVVRLETLLKDPARGIREFSRQALEKAGYKVRPDGFAYTIDDR